MRLHSQSIRTQLMVQNMLKSYSSNARNNRLSDTAAVLEKAYSRLEKSSDERLNQLNYSKESIAKNAASFSSAYHQANHQTVIDTGEETMIHAKNPY